MVLTIAVVGMPLRPPDTAGARVLEGLPSLTLSQCTPPLHSLTLAPDSISEGTAVAVAVAAAAVEVMGIGGVSPCLPVSALVSRNTQ